LLTVREERAEGRTLVGSLGKLPRSGFVQRLIILKIFHITFPTALRGMFT
jgi:hypothetical protein